MAEALALLDEQVARWAGGAGGAGRPGDTGGPGGAGGPGGTGDTGGPGGTGGPRGTGGTGGPGGPIVAVPLGAPDGADRAAVLCRDERLVGLARRSLGEEGPVECFGCTFIVKAPGRADTFAAWHQDGHPWAEKFGIHSAVTLWIALDRVGPTEGGLAVIPGSHSRAAQPLGPVVSVPYAPGTGADPDTDTDTDRVRDRTDPLPPGGGIFGGGIDPGLVDEDRAVFLDMQPGDVSAHHPALVHGSPVNRSGRPRRALVLRYRVRLGG